MKAIKNQKMSLNVKLNKIIALSFGLTSIQIVGMSNCPKELNNNLIEATEVGNYALTKDAIAKGANVNYKGFKSFSPLFLASNDKSKAKIVKLLIDNNADVDIKNYEKKTPLINAACNGNLAAVKLLIENGADMNIRYTDEYLNLNNYNALDCAKHYGHDNVVKFLEEYKAKRKKEIEIVIPIIRDLVNIIGEYEYDSEEKQKQSKL